LGFSNLTDCRAPLLLGNISSLAHCRAHFICPREGSGVTSSSGSRAIRVRHPYAICSVTEQTFTKQSARTGEFCRPEAKSEVRHRAAIGGNDWSAVRYRKPSAEGGLGDHGSCCGHRWTDGRSECRGRVGNSLLTVPAGRHRCGERRGRASETRTRPSRSSRSVPGQDREHGVGFEQTLPQTANGPLESCATGRRRRHSPTIASRCDLRAHG